MNQHGNNLDVSAIVDVTNCTAVSDEVARIYSRLYPGVSTAAIERAFVDLERIYAGRFPGLHACDTPYHDVQHVLDVTLAMARLMDGHERKETGAARLGARLFRLGLVTALFHDVGYVRSLEDTGHRNGAELTLTHVSRGAEFLRFYLPRLGLDDVADMSAALIHFTGYEVAVDRIPVPDARLWRLGCLLGSADIIAQMADRCYLEKCRDRLYPEFLAGGIARRQLPDGREEVLFESGYDLVLKTPGFFERASHRLDVVLDRGRDYGAWHFGGRDLYGEEMLRNVRFAEAIVRDHEVGALKRRPPDTLTPSPRVEFRPAPQPAIPARHFAATLGGRRIGRAPA